MRTKRLVYLIGIIVLTTSASAVVAADAPKLRLHGLFQDHMVLQCGMKVPVYGWAPPRETVTLKLGEYAAKTIADPNGRWMAMLPAMDPGGPHTLTVAAGGDRVTVRDVLIGEVWVASGQSNMVLPLSRTTDGEAVAARADLPEIRFYMTPRRYSFDPLEDVAGQWVVLSAETAGNVSGTAFYFARDLRQELGRPVGILQSAVGATYLREWMNAEAFLLDLPQDKRKAELARWDRQREEANKRLAFADRFYKTYNEELDRRMQAEKPAGRALKQLERAVRAEVEKQLGGKPDVGGEERWLYNGMVSPLTRYAVRGVIWYQGEWDAWMKGYKDAYGYEFRRMIRGWRKAFGRKDLPFGFVQLQSNKQFGGKNYPVVREGQRSALALPNTGMAVIFDVAHGLHPGNKKDTGGRLALWALATVYGKDIPYSGPMLKEAGAEDGAMRLSFTHVDGGLVAKDGKLTGFELAGEDKQFKPAEASIDGETVLVKTAAVPKPAYVRYCWQAIPDPPPSLFNKAGLPAGPFTTEPVLEEPK